MAQKKKKEDLEKEKPFEWVPPDFNEREFLEKDVKATKVLLITALMGFVFSIAAALTTVVTAAIGAVLLIVGAVALKWVYQLFKIDTKQLDKKTWASNIGLFMLLALGLWIIFINPPFGDFVHPEVNSVQIWVHDNSTGVWTLMTPANQATVVKVGNDVNITAKIVDNAKISSAMVKVWKSDDAGTYVDMTQSGNRWGYNVTFTATGMYFYQFKATDTSGKVTETAPVNFPVNP
ncbi:MAG: hypothetical protein WCK39_00590 [Methanomassiliicoccales archaeon]